MSHVTREATTAFYKEIKAMLISLDKREEYVSYHTPVCKVNWSSMFDRLPETITVSDMEEELEGFEQKYGELSTY